MKQLINALRFAVGAIFIFSGFVKLVDPFGFSVKLEEYFSAEVLNLVFLNDYAYGLGLFVIIFEIVLGVSLILGYKRDFTLYLLISLSIFFGFLTFYSAYFDKVKDCGCFGDAIKFTPWGSFTKDMILLFLILVIYSKREYIFPLFSEKVSMYATLFSVFSCLLFAHYTNRHLPIIDFRPYRIGNSIKAGMTVPEDAPKAVYNYYWKFNINGKEEVIKTNGSFPVVEGGKFVEFVSSELVKEGYVPPIHDFSIEKDDQDFTDQMLEEDKLVIITSYSYKKADLDGFKQIKTFTDKAIASGYRVIGITPEVEKMDEVAKSYGLSFSFYFTDQTTIKTMIRANPGIVILNKGVVKDKANFRDWQSVDIR